MPSRLSDLWSTCSTFELLQERKLIRNSRSLINSVVSAILPSGPEPRHLVVSGVNVKCFCCRRMVSEERWTSGEHRRQCAINKKHYIRSLPYVEILCAYCNRNKLRLWTRGGESFICDISSCSHSGRCQTNNGANRFSCFQCDYTMCGDCNSNINRYAVRRLPLDVFPDREPNDTPPPDYDVLESPPSYEDVVGLLER